MAAVQRASVPMLIVIGVIFLGGIAFGAVAALTSPRKPELAKATTTEASPMPSEPDPQPEPPPTPVKNPEPTKKAEPKKPQASPTVAKKPDPPKPEPKKPEPPKVELVSYERQVFPIFKAKCLTCHGDPQRKAGLDLKTVATAVMGGESGAGAVPGKPDDSSIWQSIADGSMPPAGKEKLTEPEKKLVKDWILSGAK
jgi:hypothetical protein